MLADALPTKEKTFEATSHLPATRAAKSEAIELQNTPDVNTLMRIYVSESERTGRQATHVAIVEALKQRGVRGATVFKGIEGYGRHHRISSVSVVDAYADLPVLIEVVDSESAIEGFLPLLDDLLHEGLVTLERLEVKRFRAGGRDA